MGVVKNIYTDIDLKGNELKNFRVSSLDDDPEVLDGGIYYNTKLKEFRFCIAGKWINIFGGWYFDDKGNLCTDKTVIIDNNLIVTRDTSSGGEGEDTPSAGLDEEQLQAYLDEHRYVTEDDVAGLIPDVDLTGYATEEYVRNQLSPYATKTDVSTAIANLINGAPTTLDTLKEIADALAENEDVVEALEAAIGTKANASDVYTKTQIDAEFEDYETALATKAAKSDLTALQRKHDVLQDDFDVLESTVNSLKGTVSSHTTNIGTLQGYFSNGIAKKATADASGNVITTYYTSIATHNALATRVGAAETNITNLTKNKADKATTLSGYGITNAYTKTEIDTKVTTINNTISGVSGRVTTLETWKSDISKYITIVNGNVKISTNLIVTGDTSSGGSGEDTGAEGTVTGVIVGTTKYERVSAGLLDLTSLMALYTPVSTHNNLAGRVSALEGKATAVSFTQTLTSGTKIGTITIDGVGKNIYTPTIPTAIKNPHTLSWSGYSSGSYDGSAAKAITIPSNTNQLTNGAGFITGITLTGDDFIAVNGYKLSLTLDVQGGLKNTGQGLGVNNLRHSLSFGSKTFDGSAAKTITASDLGALTVITKTLVTNALGYTPYNSTNPSGYISGITKSMVDGVLGGTASSNANKFLMGTGSTTVWSSVTKSMVATALGASTGGRYLIDTGGDVSWGTIPTKLSQFTDDVVSGKYLSLSGGMLSAEDANMFVINRLSSTSPTTITYRKDGGLLGRMGFNTDGAPVAQVGGTYQTLIHSGNIGNQSVAIARKFRVIEDITGDLNTILSSGGLARNYSSGLSAFTNAPSGASYGMVLELTGNVASSLAGQLAWDINHGSTSDVTRNLWWRASDSPNGFKYGKWHQIAFTDSNVASATKLATARTIWGKSFDGTGNVSGVLSEVKSLQMPTTNYTRTALNTENDTLRVGDAQGQLQLRGSSIIMQHAAGQTDFRINENGNITIGGGASDLAGASVKLYVNGVARASAFRSANIGIECDADGKTTGYGSEINRFGSSLYLQSREGNLYLSHTAGTTYIRGLATITGAVTMSSTLSVGGNISTTGHQSKDIGTNANSFRYGYFTGIGSSDNSLFVIWTSNTNRIVVEAAGNMRPHNNNAYTLGTSSYRWSAIYGTHGNFSASVTATTSVFTPLLQASGGLDIVANGSAAGSRLFLTSNCFRPWGDDSKLIDLGSSSIQWRNLYAVGATFSGDVTINGNLIVKGDTSSGGTAEDTLGNGETMKVFSEALLQTVNGTTKDLENGMYSYRITAAVGLNFLNVKPADTSKPCVIHLVKGGSYSLTIPVESTSGCVVTSAAGAKSTTPTVIPQYKGVTLVWDTYNEVWNVVYHGVI